MNNLLALDDERELAAFLCDVVGAKLLLSDLTTDGEPHLATDPLAALPRTLPTPATFGDRQVRHLSFWLPAAGPIRTLADAPTPTTPHDIVARRLTMDAAGDRTGDLIDFDRTPAFGLLRTQSMTPWRLAPGGYSGRPLRDTALPPEVRAAYRKAHRWIRARAIKVDPFDHCPEVRHRRPRTLGPLRCWVQPAAWRMVQSGIEIWPWNC
jgi:hypothetical protein